MRDTAQAECSQTKQRRPSHRGGGGNFERNAVVKGQILNENALDDEQERSTKGGEDHPVSVQQSAHEGQANQTAHDRRSRAVASVAFSTRLMRAARSASTAASASAHVTMGFSTSFPHNHSDEYPRREVPTGHSGKVQGWYRPVKAYEGRPCPASSRWTIYPTTKF